MASPNSNFDQINSSTLRNYLNKTFADNVFIEMPFYAWMQKNGRKTTEDGGSLFVEPLMYGKNLAATWMSGSGYGTLDTSAQDGITAAQFSPKMAGVPVTFSDMEAAQNQGRHQVVNLLEGKIKQAKLSIQDMFEEDLFLDGTSDGGNAITGLGAAVEASGSTYGNISGTTYSWWRAYEENTAAVLDESHLRTAVNTINDNKGKVDLIITTMALYEKYESLVLPAYRTQNLKMADLGFEHLAFRNIPIVFSSYCPSGVMFFLSSEAMKLRVFKGCDMSWTERREPTNQFVWTMLCKWIGQLTVNNRRQLGKLTAKTAS